MPRRPRIKLADVPQHIVQRGINREPCFFAEEDYYCYLHWLQKSAADWRCAIHSYVLMTNHVHLLVTTERPNGVAKLMQSIRRRYLQYINRSYRRTARKVLKKKGSTIEYQIYLLLNYIDFTLISKMRVKCG